MFEEESRNFVVKFLHETLLEIETRLSRRNGRKAHWLRLNNKFHRINLERISVNDDAYEFIRGCSRYTGALITPPSSNRVQQQLIPKETVPSRPFSSCLPVRARPSIYLRSFGRNSIHGAEWKHQNISILISLPIPPPLSPFLPLLS